MVATKVRRYVYAFHVIRHGVGGQEQAGLTEKVLSRFEESSEIFYITLDMPAKINIRFQDLFVA